MRDSLRSNRRAFLAACAASMAGAPLVARADGDLPATIALVVGFPPGGPNDLIARLLAPPLAERLHSSVIVENRAGADGELAAATVAREQRNPGMLLFASAGALTISPAIKKNLPYSPLRDLAPIAQVASSPFVLVVAASSPYRSAADVLQAARKAPGSITYASAGTGSPTHLAGALFCQLGHVNMLHVPYKGGGPALTDLMGGQVALYFAGVSTALPLIRAGKLRALGMTSKTPLAALPDVPTLSETPELNGYEVDNWYGVLAGAKVSDAYVRRVADGLEGAVRDPNVRQKMEAQGIAPVVRREGEFAAHLRDELEMWKRVAGPLQLG